MTNGAAAVQDERNLETVEISKTVLQDLIEATQSKARELQQLVLVPKSFEETERYAKYIRQSQTCPRTKEGLWSEADIFIAIQTGLELGISPMMALSGIAIINGRPTIWGDLALALVLRSGLVEEWYERPMKEALAKQEGYFRIKRKGNPIPIEVYFSVDDAKRANLWGKAGPWTNYPGRMLQMRPRGFGLRDGFADVLKGIGIAEEVRDYDTPMTNAVVEETIRAPKRKSEPEPLVVVDKDQATSEPASAAAAVSTNVVTQAPADPKPATPAKGEWTGILVRVEPIKYAKKNPKTKQPTGEDGTWFKLHTADQQLNFATFSSSHAEIASTAVSTKSQVKISWEKSNGKDNLKVNAIEPVLAKDAAVEEPPFEPGSDG